MQFLEAVSKAICNGHSSNQYAPNERINVAHLVDILKKAALSNAHPSIRVGSKKLIMLMATNRWKVSAGPHSGGVGGKNRPPDKNKHITVSISGCGSYHIWINKSGFIYQITGDKLNTIDPWVAPSSGSTPGKKYTSIG